MENDGFTMENDGFTMENDGFTMENDGFTMENDGFTMENASDLGFHHRSGEIQGLAILKSRDMYSLW